MADSGDNGSAFKNIEEAFDIQPATGLAMDYRNCIGARKFTAQRLEGQEAKDDPDPEKIKRLEDALMKPVQNYAGYYRDRYPDKAEELIAKADPMALLSLNAVVAEYNMLPLEERKKIDVQESYAARFKEIIAGKKPESIDSAVSEPMADKGPAAESEPLTETDKLGLRFNGKTGLASDYLNEWYAIQLAHKAFQDKKMPRKRFNEVIRRVKSYSQAYQSQRPSLVADILKKADHEALRQLDIAVAEYNRLPSRDKAKLEVFEIYHKRVTDIINGESGN